MSPEELSAILRDPDDPRCPFQITVFCDVCGGEHTGDYLIHVDDDQQTRFEHARAYLRTQGWRCDDTGDFHPECVKAAESEASDG